MLLFEVVLYGIVLVEFGLVMLVLVCRGEPGDDSFGLELEGSGPCADLPALEAHVSRFSSGFEEPVKAGITIVETQPPIEARVALWTASGRSERMITASSCTELFEAVALIVAIAAEPREDRPVATPPDQRLVGGSEADRTLRASIPEPRPTTGASSASEREPAPARTVAPSRPRDERPDTRERARKPARGVVWAASGVAAGLLPVPTPTVEVGLGVRWPSLSLSIDGTYQFVRGLTFSPEVGSVALSAWGAGANGCFVHTWRVLSFSSCASAEGGLVMGEGRGFAIDRTADRPWLGLGARGELGVRFSHRIWALASAEGMAHLIVPRFQVSGLGDVHRAGAFGARMTLGLSVGFR